MKGRREKEKLADNKEVYAVRAHMKKKVLYVKKRRMSGKEKYAIICGG